MASLPERVLSLLEEGIACQADLARELKATSGAMSATVASLLRRGRIELDHTEETHHGGRPRAYYRLTATGQAVAGSVRRSGAGNAEVLAPRPLPLPAPVGDALGEEVRLLHAAYHVDADILEAVFRNEPVAGL